MISRHMTIIIFVSFDSLLNYGKRLLIFPLFFGHKMKMKTSNIPDKNCLTIIICSVYNLICGIWNFELFIFHFSMVIVAPFNLIKYFVRGK